MFRKPLCSVCLHQTGEQQTSIFRKNMNNFFSMGNTCDLTKEKEEPVKFNKHLKKQLKEEKALKQS